MIKLKEYNDCTKDPLSTNVYVMCEGLFLGYSAHHKSYNYGYEHISNNAYYFVLSYVSSPHVRDLFHQKKSK